MATIYKFPLEIHERSVIRVPEGSTPLHVGLDPSKNICLWMKIPNLNAPLVPRTIACFGTGHDVPDAPLTHIGSVCHGPFIWHFFLLDIIGAQPQ